MATRLQVVREQAHPPAHTALPEVCDRLADARLEITSAGTPEQPLIVAELDALCDAPAETVARAAVAARAALPLVVGVLRRPATRSLGPMLAASTLTLTDLPVSSLQHQVVSVEDIEVALGQLRSAVAYSPQAAVACGHLLRQTIHLDTARALAAEAAVYSMLLGGPEFARWLRERGPARTISTPDRDLVRLSRVGAHLAITLDHPERRNALGARLREELLAAVQVAAVDSTITSVEISGAGTVFCSGGDLDEFGAATDPVSAYLVRLDRAPWRIMDQLADRLTVRVHGACIGAGAEMMAFGNSVVAARDTYFLLPEVRMGLVPGAGGTVSVARRIGRWRAAWIMLTGHRVPASTALRWGLVDRLVGDGA